MAGKLITLRDMLEEVYGQLKTTLAGTELGRTVEVSPHSPLWYPFIRTEQARVAVRNMQTKIGQSMQGHRGSKLDVRGAILDRIRPDKSFLVWTPNDFLDLGTYQIRRR